MNAPLLIPTLLGDIIPMLLLITRGQQVRYHRGHLGVDRLQSDRVHGTARCAADLEKTGRAHLIQRRNNRGSYDYIAVGRR